MSDAPVWCPGCGRPQAGGDHEPCRGLLAFDPPRFCRACGLRLDVQVYPAGYRASCRRCRRRGEPAGSGDGRAAG